MSSDFQPTLSEDLLNDFYAESDEHLTAIRKVLSTVGSREAAPGQAQLLAEDLLRSFHSLKGICGIVGLAPAEEVAHQAEDLLRAIFQGKGTLTEDRFDLLAKVTQRLEQIVAAFRAHQPLPEAGPLIHELTALCPKSAEAAEPARTVEAARPPLAEADLSFAANAALSQGLSLWHCFFEPSPALDRRGINISQVRARLKDHGEILQGTPQVLTGGKIAFEFIVASRENLSRFPEWTADGVRILPWHLPGPETSAREASPPASSPSGEKVQASNAFIAPSHFVRVDLGRLDELMRITGEMVIHRARFEDQINQLRDRQSGFDPRGLQEVNFAFTRQLRDLREALMRVRLVRMAEIFDRMPFVLRDLVRQTGKKVRLAVSGQETELDKYLVERLKDPLLHLVRNAVSHAVESPEERLAAGKPPEATITLAASTVGDWVLVEVADDGRGIDSESIVRHAVDAGLAIPEKMDDAALVDLLCSPGFSTRDRADRTSGRGFGMSVVSDIVRELGGTLFLKTEVGKGSRFTLRLPLTLIITDALIVRVDGQNFAMPQALVEEITEMDPKRGQNLDGVELLPHRGGVLPLLRLANLFGYAMLPRAQYPVLILNTERGRIGLVVDRVLSQREVVVRAMRDPLVQVPGIAGATELGDGKPVLILDASTLVKAGITRGTNHPAPEHSCIA